MSDEVMPAHCVCETLVLGCGNRLFGDDGFGPAVARRLGERPELPRSVCVLDVGTAVRRVLFDVLLGPVRPRRVVVVDAVDLARLPWELISYEDDHLVASGLLQFTRYITFGQATAAFPVADRLEVLVVTARPIDLKPIDPVSERRAIEMAFQDLERRHLLRIHVLTPPTLDALVAAINARPYHVLHFDGHGAFARRCPF